MKKKNPFNMKPMKTINIKRIKPKTTGKIRVTTGIPDLLGIKPKRKKHIKKTKKYKYHKRVYP